MSGAAKMRHTEITIKQGKVTMTFKLPLEAGRGLVKFLHGLHTRVGSPDDKDFVPASEIFPDLNNPAKRVGIIFRGIRSKNNLTQTEVAERLGIDQSDVSKIEKGKRSIGKALAKKIEQEFGIDYRRLL